MKINKKQILLFLCYATITAYIILGNCATFNLGERLPIKIAELISLVTIFALLICKVKLHFTNLCKNIIIWMIFGTFSVLINTFIHKYTFSQVLYGLFYSVRILHLLILTSWIGECFKLYKIETRKVIDYIIYNYIVVCAIGFLQLIFYSRAFDWYKIFYNLGIYYPNPDPHLHRLVSTYFDPNFLAQCLCIPFSFSIVYWIKYDKNRYLAFAGVILAAVLLTESRSGFLTLAIVAMVLFVILLKNKQLSKKIITLAIATVIIGICLMMFGNVRVFERIFNSLQDKSTMARLGSWKRGIDIIWKNPLIGIGYNMIGFYSNTDVSGTKLSTIFGLDSSLLVTTVTTGILGIVIFIITIVQYIKSIIKRNDIEMYAIISILIASLIGCNFINLLFYVLWMFPFLIITNIFDKNEENSNVKLKFLSYINKNNLKNKYLKRKKEEKLCE